MRGLLYKEIRQLELPFLLSLLILGPVLTFTLMEFTGGAAVCVIMGALPIMLFAEDERVGWEPFVEVLPLKPEQIVNARYLLTLLLVMAGVGLSLLLGIGHCWGPDGLDHTRYREGMEIVFCFLFLLPSLWFPAIYRWGLIPGMLVGLLGLMPLTVICCLVRFETNIPLYAVMIPMQFLIFPLSWRLSIFAYKRRRARK